MKENGMKRDEIFDKLNEYKKMDLSYDSGRILGSMCTKPDSVGLEAYKMFIETNLGDAGLFTGTSMMENEVIQIMGELLHLEDASGHIVTGGTEANLMAMTVSKYLFQEKNDATPEIILPRSAHFSFKKIISMLSLKAVYVPLTDDYKIDVSKLEDLITENTMAIVAIAGTTELGVVDNIPEISKIANKKNIYLHVDAALGGFIIPFMNKEKQDQYKFDFLCEGVDSITVDPHKMGLAPVPAGGIIFRKKKHLEKLAVQTPYLTKKQQTTIVGTRTGAGTASIWTILKYYGKKGYKEEVNNIIQLTKYTYNELKNMKNIKTVTHPELNIISFIPQNIEVETLQEKLRLEGWYVSVSEHPHAIRIVIMPHVKKKHINEFLKNLKKQL